MIPIHAGADSMADANNPTIPSAARQGERFAGMAMACAAFTGAISLIAAFLALLRGDAQAMGMCLIAAALAYGALANATTRA
jgi:hypothetical protein